MGLRASLGLALATLAVAALAVADPGPVAVEVGGTALTTADVEQRFSDLPAFQRKALGDSPATRVKRFVETALVPELLYAKAAEARGLDDRPAVRWRIAEAYHRALMSALGDEVRKDHPVTDEDVAAYYKAHESDFRSDERILIWRILVDDQALARRILKAAKGPEGPARWRALAREHSLDSATKMRAGQLGFVGADGRTDVPQVRVDPRLYEAASKVADGQLVPEPLAEGEHLAVVWRRGTRAASGHTVDEAKPRIVELLERKRTTEALGQLVKTLRKNHLSEHHPELLEHLPKGRPDDLRRSRPSGAPSGRVPRPPAASLGAPADSSALAPPEPTAGGFR